MPKSKHRLKKNGKRPVKKNKECLSAIFVPPEDIEKLKSVFTDVELLTETKLHKGICTFDDVAQMRDVLNFCAWGTVYLAEICDTISEEWLEVNMPIFLKAQEAFHTFYGRGNAKGGVDDPTVRYVATGDELIAIKDGIAIGGDFCQQMLDEIPLQFLKLWFRMKSFLSDKGAGKLEFDGDKLAQQIKRY